MRKYRTTFHGSGRDPHQETYQLIAELLELTTPVALPDVASEARWVAAGLLYRCRHLLRAIVLLSKNNNLFISAGLVRQVFEHVATGTWLLTDDAAYDRVLGAYLKHLENIKEARPATEREMIEELLDSVAADTGDDAIEAKILPKLEDRLVEPLKPHYKQYRILCGLDHPGLATAAFSLVPIDGNIGSLDAPPPWGEEQSWLAYAGCLTAGLALLVDNEFQLGHKLAIAGVMFRLNEEIAKWHPSNSEPSKSK